MKTLNLTPLWQEWMKTALFTIEHTQNKKSAINQLRQDFMACAKLADQMNNEYQNQGQPKQGTNTL